MNDAQKERLKQHAVLAGEAISSSATIRAGCAPRKRLFEFIAHVLGVLMIVGMIVLCVFCMLAGAAAY